MLNPLKRLVHRAHAGPGVHVDHGCDLVRYTIADRVAREPGAAVHGQDDGCVLRGDGVRDGGHVIGLADARAVGLGRFEARQGEGGDVVAVRAQERRDLVPGPGTQPEAGDEDDGCCAHAPILGAQR